MQTDLQAGTTIIVDRYYYSGCVYSAAKHIPGLDLAWARHPEEGLLRPDLCVFLDISPEEAAKRGGYGDEKYEKREMQDRVRVLFGELMEKNGEREDLEVVDAGRGVKEVHQSVLKVVREKIEKVDAEGRELTTVIPW
jgi:dTMP kinase